MQQNKLKYVDGLRGAGALLVYFCHFVFTFYYAASSLNPNQANTRNAVEVALGKTPVNLLFNGNFAVRLFFIISGYVLCLSYFRTYDKKKLREGQVKRYFRLVVPILFTNIVIYLMMRLGFYHNVETAQITKSMGWLNLFNDMTPNFVAMLKESLFGAFLFGSNVYNGVLWTIPVLFIGAVLIYAIAGVLGRWKYRYTVYAVMVVLLLLGDRNITIDYIAMLSGYFLCDFMQTQGKWVVKIRKAKALIGLVFLIGLYLASYPSQPGDNGAALHNTIYGILKVPMVVPYHFVGAFCIVFAVLNGSYLQKFFSLRMFTYLGKVSFSLYLIHFPLIATFSCWFFLQFYQTINYHLLVLVDFLGTTVLVLLVSTFMNRYIEGAGKKVEEFVVQRFTRERVYGK